MRFTYLLFLLFPSILFGQSEFKLVDGEIVYLYYERQKEVESYNSRVSSVPFLTNEYAKPTDYEVMISTSFSGLSFEKAKKLFTKDGMIDELRKDRIDKNALASLASSGVDVFNQDKKVTEKLNTKSYILNKLTK